MGFAFFTLATILGALWAAEAWGGYWSWDPKETWALIVLVELRRLAAHAADQGLERQTHGPVGDNRFFVTLFAFLGVNMFLSGLHSYGEL
ncbi:cytochrome c biogenesis protein CcsA [Methylomonas rivi]|uniref:Cytochrome c biogenesis protein CcsA n=1 Tax=Methylomonas rivi TaxID=2952226 RepID=A0ABT1U219_9GAMM|nr:cytochrome c biogenesis protein CcsA [Methylomonas sp. WSC-6]MCQ8127859.1 cytochrome c biogenesis protein CcsA [Methylomonas sp. WSC-6]